MVVFALPLSLLSPSLQEWQKQKQRINTIAASLLNLLIGIFRYGDRRDQSAKNIDGHP